MPKTSDLSPRKKGQVHVSLENSDLSQSEIARRLEIHRSSVCRIKKKLEIGDTLNSKRVGRCGRKRATTKRLDRIIVTESLKNRRASCRKLFNWFRVSRKTVNRRLLEAGLKSYRPRKKTRLTETMKKARLDWALQHKDWTLFFPTSQ